MTDNDASECASRKSFAKQLTRDQLVLREFLRTLESLPVLWDTNNPDYINKSKRLPAYELLLMQYRKIKRDATIKDVKMKINCLRSNYRKELRKVQDSKNSGGEIYRPMSWVFYMMQFLNQNEERLSPIPSLEWLVSPNIKAEDIAIKPKPPKIRKIETTHNKLLEKACSFISQRVHQPSSSTNTKTSATALYWTRKLEQLSPTQALFAEKAINDILFEAELGNLVRDSVQINVLSHHSNGVMSDEPVIYSQENSPPHQPSSPDNPLDMDNSVHTQYI